MSTQITTAFVKQFGSNIYTLAQQKGSRLKMAVRNESLNGDAGFFERIGSVAAQLKVSRHGDTPQIDTPHTRRRVTMNDYEWADLIDKPDKLRLLIDPTSAYSQAAMWAMGRAMDDVIIAAALGSAYSGVDGSTAVPMANANKLVGFDGTSVIGTNLNIDTLRMAKKYFDASDIDESIPRYMAVGSSQIASLLAETEITSNDYNTIKALVNGQIDTFMGFKFIRTERLLTTAATTTYDEGDGSVGSGSGTAPIGCRRCIAWAQDGIILATGDDMKAKIAERADKSFSTQVYASMSIGATRMEEAKVLEVICSEA